MSSSENTHVPQPEYDGEPLVPESDESSDSDSAIGGLSYATSTTSARSEVYATVEEFGRTYHSYKAGKYMLPNDEKERDRLDLQHMLWLLTIDNALYCAPLESPRHVLDIATGTGNWAVEFADQHPNSRVVGTDLSPIQPDYVPVNCSFEIADAEDDWNYGHQFDFIHGRALLSCFTDPRSIIQKAYNSLAPGGWLELQDGLFPLQFLDPQPPADHPLRIFVDNLLLASRVSGRPLDNVQHYARWMREIGFEEVNEKGYHWPCGPWAKGEKMKKIGVYFLEDMKHVVEPMGIKLFCKVLGWSEERARELVTQVIPMLGARRVYMYEPLLFVYGRKPLAAAQ